MPTIHDPLPRPISRASARRGCRSTPIGWPIGLMLLLAALAGWRVSDGQVARSGERSRPGPAIAAAQRGFGDLRLVVPKAWTTLSRSDDHVTWGDADRLHTVTLASTEASVLPLAGVVAGVVEESREQLPGARLVGRPTALDLGEAAGARDSAMMIRYEVAGPDGHALRVAQVWRRDARAQRDVVATWTSADGRWPVRPGEAVPLTVASR